MDTIGPEQSETSRPVALVVGASRGLGLTIARELLERGGHRVVVAAREPAELDDAVFLLSRSDRPDVLARRCDVRSREEVEALVAWTESEVGTIDVAITVAGVIDVGPVEATSWDMYEDALATMCWGPIHVALTVLPAMRRRGRGRIATITSIGGMVPAPHLLPYVTAKFAAVGFTDGLAVELAGTGVTVTTVVPGLMRTGGHAHARFTGDAASEYAWFATAASTPLVSADVDRAARRIVTGVLAGRPIVVITPLAWIGIRVRGLAPGLTTRALGLAKRTLPRSPGTEGRPLPERRGRPEGQQVEEHNGSSLVRALTVLGRRAARRKNQL